MRANELLGMLLYGLDLATRPTLPNLIKGGTPWEQGLGPHSSQLSKLRQRGLVEREGEKGSWVVSLTEEGRLRALGGRDSSACWARPWDGMWRMILFDLDSGNGALRQRLLRWLRRRHFGCLQRSVWVNPDPQDEVAEFLRGAGVDPSSVLLFEGEQVLKQTADGDIVREAWDFVAINAAYSDYLKFAAVGVPGRRGEGALARWMGREKGLWAAAMSGDPLLPDALLPEAYLGKEAWEARRSVLLEARPLLGEVFGEAG